jgi:hypothetical protein
MMRDVSKPRRDMFGGWEVEATQQRLVDYMHSGKTLMSVSRMCNQRSSRLLQDCPLELMPNGKQLSMRPALI